jgi:hypothetical protein
MTAAGVAASETMRLVTSVLRAWGTWISPLLLEGMDQVALQEVGNTQGTAAKGITRETGSSSRYAASVTRE